MPDKIFVAYASCSGATAGVAEAIGKTLAEGDLQVDVLPVQEVKDHSPYRAVVAGSAIREGAWQPEALQFVQKNRATLADLPFAAFPVCMTLAMPNGEQFRPHAASWLEPERTLVKPVSEGLFAGALDIKQISSWSNRLKFRVSVATGLLKEGDLYDWGAIRAWAESLRPLLLRGRT